MDEVRRIAEALSDGQLLERTRAGDHDAFGVLYERRHGRSSSTRCAHACSTNAAIARSRGSSGARRRSCASASAARSRPAACCDRARSAAARGRSDRRHADHRLRQPCAGSSGSRTGRPVGVHWHWRAGGRRQGCAYIDATGRDLRARPSRRLALGDEGRAHHAWTRVPADRAAARWSPGDSRPGRRVRRRRALP
jgi:hypothetical protein